MKLQAKTRVARVRSIAVVILAALVCIELVLLTVRPPHPPDEAAVHVRTGSVSLPPAMPPGSGPAAPELTIGGDGEAVDVVASPQPPAQPGSGAAARELTDAEIRDARERGVVP